MRTLSNVARSFHTTVAAHGAADACLDLSIAFGVIAGLTWIHPDATLTLFLVQAVAFVVCHRLGKTNVCHAFAWQAIALLTACALAFLAGIPVAVAALVGAVVSSTAIVALRGEQTA